MMLARSKRLPEVSLKTTKNIQDLILAIGRFNRTAETRTNIEVCNISAKDLAFNWCVDAFLAINLLKMHIAGSLCQKGSQAKSKHNETSR